jgi:membrane protease YdiL (CAAX protease family)
MDNLIDKVDTEPTKPDPGSQPVFFTFMLLIVAVLVGSLIGNLLVLAISQAQGISLQELLTQTDENSPLPTRNFLRLVNLVSHFMTFSLPSIALIFFLYRDKALSFFKLDRTPLARNIFYSILFIFISFPLAQFTYWLNQQLPLPEWAIEMENSAEGMLKSVLNMQSSTELFYNLLVVAVIPAIGEELLFRGIIQQKLAKAFGNAVLAVWVTGILFSAIHLQFQGFIPRMILGAMLGYLLVWTRNLWIPIIAHFFFNGAQVVAQYYYGAEIDPEALNEMETAPWLIGILSTVALIVSGYFIYQKNKERFEEEEGEQADVASV